MRDSEVRNSISAIKPDQYGRDDERDDGALRPGDLGVAQQRQGRQIELQEGIACIG